MSKMIRDVILAELERQGRTRYWLAKECGIHPSSIYRMLSGGNFRTDHLESMMAALSLRLGYPVGS